MEAGNDYCIGTRKNVRNDKPIIAAYGVNQEGSGDMYYKGGNMLHMVRQILGDTAFRGLLRGLNADFYHQTVTSAAIEQYISRYANKDLSKMFDQYLRTTQIPVLEYKVVADNMFVRWTNCVKGFNMPVKVAVGGGAEQWISPGDEWKMMPAGGGAAGVAGGGSGTGDALTVDRNFFVTVKKADPE